MQMFANNVAFLKISKISRNLPTHFSEMVGKQLIYFCGSMRAGRQDVDLYGSLVASLGK